MQIWLVPRVYVIGYDNFESISLQINKNESNKFEIEYTVLIYSKCTSVVIIWIQFTVGGSNIYIIYVQFNKSTIFINILH